MAIGLAVVFALQSLQATPVPAASVVEAALLDIVADAEALALGSSWLGPSVQSGESSGDNRSDRLRDPARDRGSSSASTSGAPTLNAAGSASTPQGRTFGIGIQLGYPTALSLKYMLRADQGIQGGVGGFSGFAYDVGAFSLHADYVFHPHVLTRADVFALTWYVGGGANVLVFGNPRQRTFLPGLTYYYYPTTMWLAARVPIGVNLAFRQQPFEVFLEAVPSLLVFPGMSFGFGASLGGRFYF